MNSQKFTIRLDPKILVTDPFSRSFYIWSSIGVLLMLLIIAGLWGFLPAEVPIFYTLPWGEGRLAPKIMLLIMPLISTLIIVINIILGKSLKLHHLLITRMLAATTGLTALMLLLAILGIVQSIV